MLRRAHAMGVANLARVSWRNANSTCGTAVASRDVVLAAPGSRRSVMAISGFPRLASSPVVSAVANRSSRSVPQQQQHVAAAAAAAKAQWPLGALRAHKSVAATTEGPQITFHFRLRDGNRKTVTVPHGTSVLEAAHANEVDLEGACEASLACSTCHVILQQELFDNLEEACEKEEDLLDLAPCLTSTSRLACQVIADERLEDQEVGLPKMTVNFYVDGFVPTPH